MKKVVQVSDSMQKRYSYELVAPIGSEFDTEFKPELTPKEMLELGVFGGRYLNECVDEFPADWYENARLSSNGSDPTCNFFEVSASQPLRVWQEKGWIHQDDPRGWFQWYCRYYIGRRLPEEDKRQIKRWKAITRHAGQIRKACHPGDLTCHRKQRQALLHWAYDSRKI
ncbi:hypothetical protein KBD20_01250 [Candidatus Saccharibacteria bacterium]|nr:hypothetical protein [Candidatus Saccharibacteria bacterium]